MEESREEFEFKIAVIMVGIVVFLMLCVVVGIWVLS